VTAPVRTVGDAKRRPVRERVGPPVLANFWTGFAPCQETGAPGNAAAAGALPGADLGAGDTRRLSRRHFLRQALLTGGAACASAQTSGCRSLAGSPRAGWQIGAYTRPWDQWDYRTALDGIAEAGFKSCGVMTAKSRQGWLVLTERSPLEDAAEVGAEVRQRGLACLSLYAGEFPVAESVAAGVAGLRKLVNLCRACGSPNLMLAGVGDAKLYDAYFKVIAECCPYAAAKGIGLSLKPHGGFVATGADCRKGVERVGHQDFRVWYDPGNIFYYSDGQLDPVRDAADVDGLVSGMSVKDFRPPKDVMVTPGTGQVDWSALMARLRRGGFRRGPLLVETLERGDRAHVLASARQAREFLEDLTSRVP
jgi:sugar phosphate isomerase/epimerase